MKRQAAFQGGFRGTSGCLQNITQTQQESTTQHSSKGMPRNKIIPYRKDLKFLARKLRNNSTLSEVLLWNELKNKQILGFQFHRQVPMLDYIVDFYCHELMLAIEVDGDSHGNEEAMERDDFRQNRLENEGVRFLRFLDGDVKQDMGAVLDKICYWVEENG